jgi:1,4-alpha-glucan branching enzyme
MGKSTTAGRKRVTFHLETEPGKEVYIVGSFNDWDPEKKMMIEDEDGKYSATLMLPKGRHEYKFIIDNEWCIDNKNTEHVQNEHGTWNSVVVVE